ncbi:MAG: glutamate synthase subunit alpha, partial [Planctomycetota bacterium]|nr:glutamate synthase subunit alpha [Planctomycetota bacterium]
MNRPGFPKKQGLYDPAYEHDACGIGFVVHLRAEKTHQLIDDALQVLVNLDHRGACGCEDNTGDGAGILMQMPDKFLRHHAEGLNIELPDEGHYGVGMVYLPMDRDQRHACERKLEELVESEGLSVLGWRSVPTDNYNLGATAKRYEPFMRQVFIQRSDDLESAWRFEQKLYVMRRIIEKALQDMPGGEFCYVPSLSYKTLVYKGMLTPAQVSTFYPDLSDHLMETGLALIHSRFST